MDFMNYAGDPTSAETDPMKWEYLKMGPDGGRMLRGQPVIADQLGKLRNYGT